jgi:hypothetical protein
VLLPQVRPQVIPGPEVPLPPSPPKPAQQTHTTNLEQVNRTLIREIQTALCVTPVDGDLGGLPGSTAQTRVAIRKFLSGRNRGSIAPDGLAASKADELRPSRSRDAIFQAIAEARNKDGGVRNCSDPTRGFMNAFEVGLYGDLKPEDKVSNVKSLQAAMQYVLGDKAKVPDSGALDETTRQMIDNVRGELKITGPKGQLDYNLYKALGKP